MLDVFYGAYMDHSAGPGVLDYQCGAKTFDGHRGVDILLRNFQVQDSGVAVLAAGPGGPEPVHVVTGHVGPSFSMRYLTAPVPVKGVLADTGTWEIRTYLDGMLLWTEPIQDFPQKTSLTCRNLLNANG